MTDLQIDKENVETSSPYQAPSREISISSKRALLEALGVFFTVFVFWFLFATNIQTFYRDDNVGGVAPIVMDNARRILNGQIPNHTEYVGGGGGAYILMSMSGVLNPFQLIPSLVFRENPKLLLDFVMSLHLALFAVGGYFLTLVAGGSRWIRLTAGFSLGFSGYFFVWGGNWLPFLIPYAFLPWLMAGILKIAGTIGVRAALPYHILTVFAGILLAVTGGPFPPYFSAITVLILLAHIFAEEPRRFSRSVLRLLIPGLVIIGVALPVLLGQKALFDFYGGRIAEGGDFEFLSIPLNGYLGLFIPTTLSMWQIPWFSRPAITTNIVLMCGFIPAWYLLAALFRKPALFLRPANAVLAAGILVFVVILSPGALSLADGLARIPLVNAFRWPFRGLPAFHVLGVFFFIVAARELDQQIHRLTALAIGGLAAAMTIAALGHEVNLLTIRNPRLNWFQEVMLVRDRTPVTSWYHITPHLDDPEVWDEPTLDRLRRSGFVLNICRSEVPFHAKPRLFFYGNMGAQFKVHTVHLYVVPFPSAYGAFDMTEKGCIRNWDTVRYMIENGPQHPIGGASWNNPRGPENFMEIMEKTYVGAIVVDKAYEAPMKYLTESIGWTLLADTPLAALFVRK